MRPPYISLRVLSLLGILGLGAVVFLFVLSRCGEPPHSKRVVAVLVDRSQSADDRSEAVYRDAIARVLPYLSRRGGRISIGIIDDRSHLRPMEPFDIPAYSASEANPITYASELLTEQARVCDRLDEVFAHIPDSAGTEILDAIDNAEGVLTGLPEGSERYLVVLSDMIEESDRLPPLNDHAAVNDIDALIEAERAAGRLPDLTRARVYVSGAGITDKGNQPSERTRTWRLFWRHWFGATGALLDTYGLSLSSFPGPAAQEPLGCELIFLRALGEDVRSHTLRLPLQAADRLVVRGRDRAACALLDEFDRRVALKREHGELGDSDADDFRDRSANIRRLLGCTGPDS